VALLAHAKDDAKRAVFYPFTLLSTEWQAIQLGIVVSSDGEKTFKEAWRLYWQPELMIELIEQAVYGNTILGAAQNFVKEQIQELDKLDQIVQLLNR